MALLNQYVLTYGKIPAFFERIREGQAPEKFTRQHLKDIGFKSSNHHAFIPLLKGLGFLSPDGTPTQRYKDYLDKTRSKQVLGQTVRDNYGDIFSIKAEPKKSDKDVIAGKFKSTYNLSDNVAERTASTFLALLDIADKDVAYGKAEATKLSEKNDKQEEQDDNSAGDSAVTEMQIPNPSEQSSGGFSLCYNIQIHLPPTKDIEVPVYPLDPPY